MPSSARPIRAVFFSANVHGQAPIEHGEEFLAMRRGIALGAHREQLEATSRPASSRAEIIADLRALQPEIVHLSCHGHADGMALRDDYGAADPVSASWLAQRLQDSAEIKLLIVSACRSDALIEAVAAAIRPQEVDLIGCRGLIDERDACRFTECFYRAFADGGSVGRAFRDACGSLSDDASGQLVHLGAGAYRVLPSDGQRAARGVQHGGIILNGPAQITIGGDMIAGDKHVKK